MTYAQLLSHPVTRTVRTFVRRTVIVCAVILAVAIVPLVLVTLARARAARFDAHKRLARITLPIWLYVSATGVVVYWMLYRL